jgi:hypothetical protein
MSIAKSHAAHKTSYEPSPATALNSRGGSVKALLEFFHRSEVTFNGLLERPVSKLATVGIGRRKVLPEKRVIDVSYTT